MSYSFDFGAQVTRICMNEIRRRGLDERKILRKSAPNSMLLLRVFRQQNCTADDLIPVSIHSVATLMQDTLWCCQERIVPRKVWRIINYETCTLPNLSKVLTKQGEALLIEILDFLVELMQHKKNNLMDAYHLGEAMGKVTLGPADCDPIIAEKAGHFMTRMIIEHSKRTTMTTAVTPSQQKQQQQQQQQQQPMSKSEATRAKARSYNRLIRRIQHLNVDWIDHANIGLWALMENDYIVEPPPSIEPWISIFTLQLDPICATTSPLLYRILSSTLKKPPPPLDPFAYWDQSIQPAELKIKMMTRMIKDERSEKEPRRKKLLSDINLDQGNPLNNDNSNNNSHGSGNDDDNCNLLNSQQIMIQSHQEDVPLSKHHSNHHHQVKNLMRRMIKRGHTGSSSIKNSHIVIS